MPGFHTSSRRASRSSSHRGKTAKNVPPDFKIPASVPPRGYQPPYGQRPDLPYPQTPVTGVLHMPAPTDHPLSPPASRSSGSRTSHGNAGLRDSIGHLDSANPQPNHAYGQAYPQHAHDAPYEILMQQDFYHHPERPPTPPRTVIDQFGKLTMEEDLPMGSEALSFHRSQIAAGIKGKEAALEGRKGCDAASADSRRSRVGSRRSRSGYSNGPRDGENMTGGAEAHEKNNGSCGVGRRSSMIRVEEHGQRPRRRGEADAYYDENVTFSSDPPFQHFQSQHPAGQPVPPPPQAQDASTAHEQQNLHEYHDPSECTKLASGPIGLLKEYSKARAGDQKFQEGGNGRHELLKRTNGFWNEGRTGKIFDVFRFHPEKRSRFKQSLERHKRGNCVEEQRGEGDAVVKPLRRQHERSRSCWCLNELRACSHEGHSPRLHVCPRRSCKNAEGAS
ncbi:hypothetical protein EJ03DRAFT_352005 [Teratosphaeria nubilosa]|uniref:Uncharacterized protein n=1 Tax=Teratosphaeria nubilosa TaxID=161662 RepID=A0A6G1L7N2_9PEZI|nr:hypothetical protein EJ03DRAFT_352005 [Teratosphaeria nubilosa]